MRRLRTILGVLGIAAVAYVSIEANPQQAALPTGVYDIPPGFDFPANKQTLEQYRSTANLAAQRLHVWKVFAGMTQLTPDGKYPIFETWFSEDETFQTGPTPQALAPHRVVRRFREPDQFRTPPGFAPQAAGSALLSFVLYNYAAYSHIRNNQLYRVSQLESLLQSGVQDPKFPKNRDIPSFTPDAVSLKTVWWPVAKDKVTAMPIWDPEANPAKRGGNPYTTWARVVAVDPTRSDIPANEATKISFMGTQFPNSHIVGLSAFYHIQLDEQAASNAMQDPGIKAAAQIALGRDLQAGDYTVLAATHLTTKEIDDWVWATFWWHDRPNDGPFATGRPSEVAGVWRNYLMSESFDVNLPREKDGSPHVAFNPWLEARFRDGGNGGGVVSNCMNCHNRASYPGILFLPIYRGDPDLKKDPAFGDNRLRTDLLWSIPDEAQ